MIQSLWKMYVKNVQLLQIQKIINPIKISIVLESRVFQSILVILTS